MTDSREIAWIPGRGIEGLVGALLAELPDLAQAIADTGCAGLPYVAFGCLNDRILEEVGQAEPNPQLLARAAHLLNGMAKSPLVSVQDLLVHGVLEVLLPDPRVEPHLGPLLSADVWEIAKRHDLP